MTMPCHDQARQLIERHGYEQGWRWFDRYFFPNDYDDRFARQAQELCRGCPLRMDCLEQAREERHRSGVWAGLTPGQREKLEAGRTTLADLDHAHVLRFHGATQYKRGCRCPVCTARHTSSMREKRRRNPQLYRVHATLKDAMASRIATLRAEAQKRHEEAVARRAGRGRPTRHGRVVDWLDGCMCPDCAEAWRAYEKRKEVRRRGGIDVERTGAAGTDEGGSEPVRGCEADGGDEAADASDRKRSGEERMGGTGRARCAPNGRVCLTHEAQSLTI